MRDSRCLECAVIDEVYEERKGMSRMDFSKVDSTMNTGTFPTALTAEERTFRSAQDKNGLTEKQALQSLKSILDIPLRSSPLT